MPQPVTPQLLPPPLLCSTLLAGEQGACGVVAAVLPPLLSSALAVGVAGWSEGVLTHMLVLAAEGGLEPLGGGVEWAERREG